MNISVGEQLKLGMEQVWNSQPLQQFEQVFAEDFTSQQLLNPVMGPEGVRQLVELFQDAFPDLEYQIEDLIQTHDRVVVRWSFEGTHTGDLMGFAPTGKRARLTGISIYRMKDGKVIQSWDEVDLFRLLYQLGGWSQEVGLS